MVQTDIDFLKYYRNFRYGWIVALFILAGGTAGWIFHRLQPPVYQAQVSLNLTVDFSQTGNISAYNLDQAEGAVAKLFYTPGVIQPIVKQAEIPPSETFNVFKIERYGDTWVFNVFMDDPEKAAHFVNQWAEAGYQALLESHSHALRARILSVYINNLASCPVPPEYTPALPPICLGNYTLNPEAVQGLQEQLQQEVKLSNAINASMLFHLNALAEPPAEPVLYARSWVLMAGMLLGLLIGILIFSRIPIPGGNP